MNMRFLYVYHLIMHIIIRKHKCKIYIFTFSPVLVAGPTELTVVKFWQMVWEYQLTTIVMLTRCVEDNKVNAPTTAYCSSFMVSLSLSSQCHVIESSQGTFSNVCPDWSLISSSSLSPSPVKRQFYSCHSDSHQWNETFESNSRMQMLCAQKNVSAFLYFCPPTQQFILTTAIVYLCRRSVNNTGLMDYSQLWIKGQSLL